MRRASGNEASSPPPPTNKERRQSVKIFIATPMYGGNCKGIYTESLINLIVALANKGHQTVYSKVYNESLITRARNALVYEFEKTDCDALLFIDSDHWFDADHVVKMIESGVDLIGAIYPMKNINWDMVRNAALQGKEDLSLYSGFFSANLPKGQVTIKLDEPLEVVNVATGMMFIRRNVFEAMKPRCKTYAHHGATGAIDFNQSVTEYFATEVDENGILLSEDYYFCRKWQDLGNKVYAAPWVNITHAGDYNFPGNFAQTVILRSQLETSAPAQPTLFEEDSEQSSDTTSDHSE